MLFSQVVGNSLLKNHLIHSVSQNRISHGQLFVSKQMSGGLAMAIAYARLLLCGDQESDTCRAKFNSLVHPDLHFSYPVCAVGSNTKPTSSLFLEKWRIFVKNNPYGTLLDWHSSMGSEKKIGFIYVPQVEEILESLRLKPIEGDYRVLIMWLPEKLQTAAANKLLKILEEPPANVIFLMVTQDEDSILPTIRSRLQSVYLRPLKDAEIEAELISRVGVNRSDAADIAFRAQGSWGEALRLLGENKRNKEYQHLFVDLVRSSFKTDLPGLIRWSHQVSDKGRNELNDLLVYFSQVFRQSMLNNYGQSDLMYMQIGVNSFRFDDFSRYVHGRNIPLILQALDSAIYHINGNVNIKIVLTDMAVHIARCLHMKSALEP